MSGKNNTAWESNPIVDMKNSSTNLNEWSVEINIMWSTKNKLTHALLAKQVKTAIDEWYNKLDKIDIEIAQLNDSVDDWDQMKSTFLWEMAQAEIEFQKKNIDYSILLESLWLSNEDIEKLFDENNLKKYLADKDKKGQKEDIESAKNLYLEIYNNHEIDAIGSLLDSVNDEISKALQIIEVLQKAKTEKIEEMNNILRDWWLDQFKYLWENNVSLSDSVLWEDVDNELKKIIYMYKNPDKIEKFWLTLPKTILFLWSKNSWKTFAAKVLKNELWQDMYHIKAQDIYAWEKSDPNAILESIFAAILEKEEKCIIFLDEIDKILENVEDSNYQKFMWNTIISNISKIKELDTNVIVIWAITDKNKVDNRFFKNDLFPKQIYLSELNDEWKQKLFDIESSKYSNVKFDNINLNVANNWVMKDISAEWIKQIIKIAVENVAYEKWESEILSVSQDDINKAIQIYQSMKWLKKEKVWF